MRKFLIEMDREITLDELRCDYYEQFADTGEVSFERYLELCMWWNNGALTEILTPDTPKGWENRAVAEFIVTDEDTGDVYTEWRSMSEFGLFA